MKFPLLLIFSALTITAIHAKKTHSKRVKAKTPEEQLAGFTVPEGFIIELVASEKNGIINPIDLTFDDAGRLWTQTAQMYPIDPVKNIKWNALQKLMSDPEAQAKNPEFKRIKELYQLKTKGQDKILIIQDPTRKVTGQVSTFAEGLTIPQSILPYKNGVYVAHGSEMLFLEDTDKDDKYDKHQSILTGFGFTDTHTMAHVLNRAPGGWVNFSQGALNKGKVSAVASGDSVKIDYSKIARFSLDGNKIELVSSGLNNIWGYQLRANGQWFGCEANDMSFSVTPMEPMSGFKGIGNAKLRAYQPFVPRMHQFRVGGTGISGLAFSEDGTKGFPLEWKNVALLANPITSTINAVKIRRDAKGKIHSTHLPDFLTSTDDWFRPVNMEFGPDGCLYIADWYNKIVSHNELPTTHPDRDKSHGRIWRIRHKSQKPLTIPNLKSVENNQLVKHLSAEIIWEKRAAWHQIVDRKAIDLVPKLRALVTDNTASVETRIHALWSLEGLREFDHATLKKLLSATDSNLRREAVRSLANFNITSDQLFQLLKPLTIDTHHMVRSEILKTISNANKANIDIIDILVSASKPKLAGKIQMGGTYERIFDRYLARRALEQYPTELKQYFASEKVKSQPVSHLLWALQALPQKEKEIQFINIWKTAKEIDVEAETFVTIAGMLNNKNVYNAIEPLFKSPSKQKHLVALAASLQSRLTSKKIITLLTPALKNLISSANEKDKHLAMSAASKFHTTVINEEVKKLINNSSSEMTLAKAVSTLAISPKQNSNVFRKISANSNLSLKIRLQVLHALSKASYKQGIIAVSHFLKTASPKNSTTLVSLLSNSRQGAKVLISLFRKKELSLDLFDLSSAEKITKSYRRDKTAKNMLAKINKREQDKKNLVATKIQNYIAANKRLTGNVEAGKITFQSCLMCHKVGQKGYDLAPALDGSASRDLESLLTAIVNPNIAVEGGYNLYRISRKDGSTVEGYMFKKDATGTTIAMMGGTKIYTPIADIKEQGFIGGRSFMPDSFGNLPAQNMVDLISYIATLKATTVKKESTSTNLFDGKSFTGWKVIKPKNTKYWLVRDGVITGSNEGKKVPTNSYLATENQYQDFEFTTTFKISGDHKTGLINSGIQYRSLIKKNKIIGYQADIGKGYWGDIYDEHRRGKLVKGDTKELFKNLKEDGWNHYKIRCKGNRHQLWINGIKTVDYIEKDKKIPTKGVIAIQLHSGGVAKVEFKDIKIKKL